MEIFFSAPAHLVFHGVIADVVKALSEFLTHHGLTPTFESFANKYMSQIMEMRIQWCLTKTFPKKLWQMENEIALARTMICIYGQFFRDITLPRSSNTTETTILMIKQMLISLNVLVSVLMSPRRSETKDIDRYVKIFLSFVKGL